MDKNLIKIIPFVKNYKINVFWNVLFNILYAFFSTLSFVALMPMLQVLFNTAEKIKNKPVYTGIVDITSYGKDLLYFHITRYTENDGPQFALMLVVAIVVTTFLLKNLFNYLALYNLMLIKNGVLKDLRSKMFDKIIELPISYYSERRKGDIMARMLGDVGEVKNSFFAILSLIIKEPVTILFTIITMLIISLKLTLFVFIFIPISGFIISRIGKTLKSKSTKAQVEGGYLISLVEESLSGLKIVKGYNAENNFIKKFNNSVSRLYKLHNSIGNKNILAGPLSEFMGIVVISVLLWYGGNMVLVELKADGSPLLEGAQFIAYMGLAYNILTPAKAISKANYSVKNGLAAAERVFSVLETENKISDTENAVSKPTFDNLIKINGITFSYTELNVLKDFSLTIEKGKSVALVGQSGSGKSTIANLLTRFYEIENGNVTIDGIDLQEIKIKDLRDLFGLVSQDSVLFNDSIAENIKLGNLIATDEEVIEALKVANAWEFVNKLPKGIHHNVGDAGGKLSGGQKQRLSIARAVLKNSPIMILDEATSALDTESERLVQDALEKLMQNRTSIIIAHRLSTIKNCDLIVVMKEGEIVEQGSHEELIAKNGNYKLLVDMQTLHN